MTDKTMDYKGSYDRDTAYWNRYYSEHKAPKEPSLFALAIADMVPPQAGILEIGCGNGRDSIYFSSHGFSVTAVDASQEAINELSETFADADNLRFIADDFVSSKEIYAGKYDNCYCRFALHAINEEQEDQLLKNVFSALNPGGRFFIEVRGIHDEIYGLGEKVGEHEYVYEGHYRRFIVREDLEKKLLSNGFRIEYSAEETGFAPYGDRDPLVIRIIATAG